MYTHEAVLFPCVMYELALQVGLVVFWFVMHVHHHPDQSEMLGYHVQGASPTFEVLNWLVLYNGAFASAHPTDDPQIGSVHVQYHGFVVPTAVVTAEGFPE